MTSFLKSQCFHSPWSLSSMRSNPWLSDLTAESLPGWLPSAGRSAGVLTTGFLPRRNTVWVEQKQVFSGQWNIREKMAGVTNKQ